MGAVTGPQIAYPRGAPAVPARLAGLERRAARALRDGSLLSVCAAQWVVGLRTLAPRLASAAGFTYRRFAPVSAAAWSTCLTVLAHVAETAYEWAGPAIACAGAGVVAVPVAVRRRSRV